MINKIFDCPNCGKKQAAVRSEAYPEIIVHKCYGKDLLEVGKYDHGKVTPVNVLKPKSTTQEIRTNLFLIEKVLDIASLMSYGRDLQNQAQEKQAASMYLKQGEIWVVKRRSSGEVQYMVLIENKTIKDPRYFSGKAVSPVPKTDGEDILKALLTYNIISKNPFPYEYKV